MGGSKYQTSRDVWMSVGITRQIAIFLETAFPHSFEVSPRDFRRTRKWWPNGQELGFFLLEAAEHFAEERVCVKIDRSCLKGVKAYMLRMWKIQGISYVDHNMRCPRSFIISLTDVISIFMLIKAIKSCS